MPRLEPLSDRAAQGLLLLLAAQALWPLRATAILLMAFAAVQLVRAVQGPAPPWKVHGLTVLALGLPFLLLALRAPFCADPHAAWLVAERTVPLLLLPVLLLLAPLPSMPRQVPLDVFSLAALLLGMRGMVPVLLDQPDLWDEPRALREAFAAASGMHAVYAAYHLFLAALVQVVAIAHRRSPVRLVLLVPCILSGALLASRMPVLAFLVALGLVLLRLPFPAARWRRAAAGAGVLALLLVAAPTLRQRTLEVFSTPPAVPAVAGSDTGERWALLHCGLALLEEHAVTGLGPDRVRGAMDMCLRGIAGGAYADGHHGPHDQLLLWWLGLGLPGAAAFALLFLVPLRLARQRHDLLHQALLVFVALCCLTEDLLDRQWGVVLFAFLNTWALAAIEPRVRATS